MVKSLFLLQQEGRPSRRGTLGRYANILLQLNAFTEKHQRSQTSYTARVMVSSTMGLNLGVFGILPNHTHKKQMQNKMHSRSSCAMQRLTCVCLHAQTAEQ